MSKRRLTFAAALVIGSTVVGHPAAQAPSLDDVLKRSAAYVEEFRKQLSEIVAEETYRQEIVNIGRIGMGVSGITARTLRSDFLLVKPPDADRHVELRDVFEVDGTMVRDRRPRLEALIVDPAASMRIGEIIKESARYNIGRVERTINTPLMALMFLDRNRQPRFQFKHAAKPQPVFPDAHDTAINESPVFRVSTEMWAVEYQERRRDTIIRAPNGDDRPAHGRFWINPTNGSVLISELVVDGGGVIATVTVSYQTEPLMGFLVPIEMRESYVARSERTSGHAIYSKFRPLRK